MDPNQQPDTPPEIINPNDNANQIINPENTLPTSPAMPQPETVQQPVQVTAPTNSQPIYQNDTTNMKSKKPIVITIVAIVTVLISILLIAVVLWANSYSKYTSITDEIIANDLSAIESVKSYHSPSKAEYIVDLQRGIDLYKSNIALTEQIVSIKYLDDNAKEYNNNKREYSTLRIKQYELIKEGLENNTEYLKNPELLSVVESIEKLLPEDESGSELKQITFKDRIIKFNDNEFAALKVVRDYSNLNYEQKISGIRNGIIIWDENLAILNQIQADGYALDINKDYLADLQKYTELRKEEFTIILAGELSNDPSYRNSERLKFLTSQIDSMQ